MSRSRGERSLTTRPPTSIVPSVMSSSPATMRSAVVLPHPDGPTRTMNSPSATSRSSSLTAWTPFGYRFVTPLSRSVAIALAERSGREPGDDAPLGEQNEQRDRDRDDDDGSVDAVVE